MKERFESAVRKQTDIKDQNEKSFNRVGNIKLFLFVLFAVAVYLSVKTGLLMYIIPAILLFFIQAFVWIYHIRIGERIDRAKGLIEVNKRHLMRFHGEWTKFSDTGEEFLDPEHPYGVDLDIVGKKSLFQFINTTHTRHGKLAFARDLLNPSYTKGEIEKRQEAISELSSAHDFSDDLEYCFNKIGNDPSVDDLVKELMDDTPFMKHKSLRPFLVYIPLLATAFTAIIVILSKERLYPVVAVLYSVQAIVWAAGVRRAGRYFHSVSRLPIKLNAYHKVLELVGEYPFKSTELKEIQSRLVILELSATQAIKELDQISERVRLRDNPILCFIINVLLLWDYECAFLFSDWKKKYAPHCEMWFEALGDLESLTCYSTLKKVCNDTCFPVLTEIRSIEAESLGHPLIDNGVRVTNDFSLKDQILIISGSNMSGKTTFLRTVGINIVLAKGGGLVCAKSMICSDLHVITSMRITDDLNNGISTFYAELKRIKQILDKAEEDQKTLFLIDEIFKGTNSVDRLQGAKTVLSTLDRLNAIGMVTTHDLELCDLDQKMMRIKNYSFEEHYEDKKILFDYKLKPGKSKTTNAKYLMELLGIL